MGYNTLKISMEERKPPVKTKRQPTVWENLFVNHIPNKGPTSPNI